MALVARTSLISIIEAFRDIRLEHLLSSVTNKQVFELLFFIYIADTICSYFVNSLFLLQIVFQLNTLYVEDALLIL